jgi:hypothetical protein
MQARKQTSQEKRARLQQGQREGQRILIDLEFADKMTHEEIKSLCKQLLYSYSANVRAQKPAQLILTSAEVRCVSAYWCHELLEMWVRAQCELKPEYLRQG